MKTNYELYLRTLATNNPNAKKDQDYETVDYEECDNYRDAVRKAKELSRKVPFKNIYGQEIQQIQIASYYDGEQAEKEYGTSYYLRWKETYENGRCTGRY